MTGVSEGTKQIKQNGQGAIFELIMTIKSPKQLKNIMKSLAEQIRINPCLKIL